jgi:hypothetical protein
MMLRVQGLEALALFATVQLLVTVGFTTRIVVRVLRLRALERLYRQRLASWAATNPASGDAD